MTEETRLLRENIRTYKVSPCSHGQDCKCSQRIEWEGTVERIYMIERREEALVEMVRLSEEAGLYDMPTSIMILCPTCGNKRCPKATDISLGCTNSNEPGQPGSAYE